jgi:hypothetical protein
MVVPTSLDLIRPGHVKFNDLVTHAQIRVVVTPNVSVFSNPKWENLAASELNFTDHDKNHAEVFYQDEVGIELYYIKPHYYSTTPKMSSDSLMSPTI